MWGSGLTLTERELIDTEEASIYTSWGGRAIDGPRDGQSLELLPALSGTIPWREAAARYAGLGGACEVYTGEILGVGCEATCPAVIAQCGVPDYDCLADCADLPRSAIDCMARSDSCPLAECGWPILPDDTGS